MPLPRGEIPVLWTFGAPTLLVLGTISNTLAIICLRRMKVLFSFHDFLMALAVTDLLALYVGLPRRWAWAMAHVDLEDRSEVTCKMVNWLEISLGMLSSWLLAAMVTQRAMSENCPLLLGTRGRRKKTKWFIACLALVLFALNSYMVVQRTVVKNVCRYDKDFKENILPVLSWINGLLYSIIPAIVILVGDVFLIRAVGRNAKIVESHLSEMSGLGLSSMSSQSAAAVHAIFGRQRKNIAAITDQTQEDRSKPDNTSDHVERHAQKKLRQSILHHVHAETTASVLTVSVFFILLAIPISVTVLKRHFQPASKTGIDFELELALLCWYVNHALKFYIFFLMGSVFRKELHRLLWVPRTTKRDTLFRIRFRKRKKPAKRVKKVESAEST